MQTLSGHYLGGLLSRRSTTAASGTIRNWLPLLTLHLPCYTEHLSQTSFTSRCLCPEGQVSHSVSKSVYITQLDPPNCFLILKRLPATTETEVASVTFPVQNTLSSAASESCSSSSSYQRLAEQPVSIFIGTVVTTHSHMPMDAFALQEWQMHAHTRTHTYMLYGKGLLTYYELRLKPKQRP